MTLENMEASTQRLSGDLTREKWDQWNRAEVQKNIDATKATASLIDLIYSQLHNHYDRMKDSEWVVTNFLSLPAGLQSVFLELIKFPIEMSTIESFFKLVLEFDATDDSIKLSEQDYSDFSRSIRATCREPSVRWEESRDTFRDLFKTANSTIQSRTTHVMIKSIVMNNAALILTHQFGEERFIEVTSAFKLQDTDVDLGTFINLVKNWGELSKYPLAWAVGLAKS